MYVCVCYLLEKEETIPSNSCKKKTINKLHKRRAMNKYIAYTPDSQAIGAVKRSVPV